MALMAKKAPVKLVPEGSYAAVCTKVIDLGTQDTPWGQQAKVMFEWVIDFKHEGGDKNEKIYVEYAVNMGKKANLYKALVGWVVKATDKVTSFDLSSIVNKPCMLSIIDYAKGDGSPGVKVDSVSKAPNGLPMPVASPEDLVVFEIENYRDKELTSKLPEWIVDKIMKAEEVVNPISSNDAADSESVRLAGEDIAI